MKNKIAIVTGVSRLNGIGRAICYHLAQNGFDIFFTYWTVYDKQMLWGIHNSEQNQIQEEIWKCGVNCEKLELDLSKEGSIKLLFDNVEQKLGSPSVLVNNATYSTQTSINNFSSEELDKHYLLNVKGTILLSLEFMRRFKGNSGGRIINLTSGQSLGQMSEEIAYAITKGAVETFTKTIYSKIAEKGITINAVNPGLTDTGWLNEESKEQWLKHFPMKRLGEPADVARLISFLAGNESEWITGQVIHSEGGFIR